MDAMKPAALPNEKPRDLGEVIQRIIALVPTAQYGGLRDRLGLIHETLFYQPPESLPGWWSKTGENLRDFMGTNPYDRDNPPWMSQVADIFSGKQP